MVFGGGGQVGCHLLEMASATGHDLIGLTHAEADICDTEAVAAAIAEHAPTSIVNAAAYTAVDKAESEAMRAFQVNRDGASVVASAAAKANVPLIHLDRLRILRFGPRSLQGRRQGQSARKLRCKQRGRRASGEERP
jgi:dTDP-4-dehydrorhamnose reductase